MSTIISVLLSVIAATIFSATGYFAKNILLRHRLKHLHYLLGDAKEVKIIFPTFFSPIFSEESAGKGASIPKNIHLMPLAEGRAITEIAKAISIITPRCQIILQTPDDFIDDGKPFISIGGPSVNSVSEEIIKSRWTDFNLIYPDHYAEYGGVTYKPLINDDCLVNDFGFAFQTRLSSGTRSLVFCGIWAIGTELAVNSYLNIFKEKEKRDTKNKFKEGKNILLISEGKVNRVWAGSPTVIGWREI